MIWPSEWSRFSDAKHPKRFQANGYIVEQKQVKLQHFFVSTLKTQNTKIEYRTQYQSFTGLNIKRKDNEHAFIHVPSIHIQGVCFLYPPVQSSSPGANGICSLNAVIFSGWSSTSNRPSLDLQSPSASAQVTELVSFEYFVLQSKGIINKTVLKV